jgi:hypothetical protein
MELKKISDTLVRTTETQIIEKEVTKDELLDKISNIDNQLVGLEIKKTDLLREKTEIQEMIEEFNRL